MRSPGLDLCYREFQAGLQEQRPPDEWRCDRALSLSLYLSASSSCSASHTLSCCYTPFSDSLSPIANSPLFYFIACLATFSSVPRAHSYTSRTRVPAQLSRPIRQTYLSRSSLVWSRLCREEREEPPGVSSRVCYALPLVVHLRRVYGPKLCPHTTSRDSSLTALLAWVPFFLNFLVCPSSPLFLPFVFPKKAVKGRGENCGDIYRPLPPRIPERFRFGESGVNGRREKRSQRTSGEGKKESVRGRKAVTRRQQ